MPVRRSISQSFTPLAISRSTSSTSACDLIGEHMFA
jgi:hypothetical protein